ALSDGSSTAAGTGMAAGEVAVVTDVAVQHGVKVLEAAAKGGPASLLAAASHASEGLMSDEVRRRIAAAIMQQLVADPDVHKRL
ncbi:hypothetical protein MNEG_13826, partial [Monoraphidium neglectum]